MYLMMLCTYTLSPILLYFTAIQTDDALTWQFWTADCTEASPVSPLPQGLSLRFFFAENEYPPELGLKGAIGAIGFVGSRMIVLV